MPDLPTLLAAITADPDDGRRWPARASRLWDDGRDDEAAAVRVFWPTLRQNPAEGVGTRETLRQVAFHRARLGQRAREAEERAARETLPGE